MQNKEYRDLVKAYGIRFVVEVTGKASTVNFASFIRIMLAIGSLAGLFKAVRNTVFGPVHLSQFTLHVCI